MFVRRFSLLEKNLQEEVVEKIMLFHDRRNHRALKVHKLHGELAGFFSFSVNYRYRIVFFYEEKDSAVLSTIGDHTVYE
jgi:plasmid maintenance system killer protein